MSLEGIAKFGIMMGREFLGLGRNIINNEKVAQSTVVGGVLAVSTAVGTFGARWLNEKFPENQAGSKKPVQKAEPVKKAAEPVKSKAAEPVKNETVKKYYVKKVDPVKSKAAETPVKSETVKKYYVKKVDPVQKVEPVKSKAAEPVKKDEPAKSTIEKLTTGSSHDVQAGTKSLAPNKVAAKFVADSPHHEDFAVDMTGSVNEAA